MGIFCFFSHRNWVFRVETKKKNQKHKARKKNNNRFTLIARALTDWLTDGAEISWSWRFTPPPRPSHSIAMPRLGNWCNAWSMCNLALQRNQPTDIATETARNGSVCKPLWRSFFGGFCFFFFARFRWPTADLITHSLTSCGVNPCSYSLFIYCWTCRNPLLFLLFISTTQ